MEKIIFTSIPKTGTHLLLRFFHLAGFKNGGPFCEFHFSEDLYDCVSELEPGEFSAWHYHWTEKLSGIIRSKKIKVVFLHRDPRAQICSRLYFVMSMPTHPYYVFFTKHLRTNEERLQRLIEGFPSGELKRHPQLHGGQIHFERREGLGPASRFPGGINQLYRHFARWRGEPHCCEVRYEDMVGPRGGGDREEQMNVTRRLLEFTGASAVLPDAEKLCDSLFDKNTTTFRKGHVDSWRDDFTPRVNEIFMRECSELLRFWDYALDPVGVS